MSFWKGIKIWDTVSSTYKGVAFNAGSPQICAQPYLQALAEGDISGHTPWSKIGYNGALVASTEADVWSGTGTINFPASAAGMELLSSDNTVDIGTVIKGDATGNTVQSDSGGSTTTLVDASVDFSAATAVAVGDCIILDPHGTTPEWGYVTVVDTHTLTVEGFSSGGTGASRYYAVIDKSAKAGAQAVKIEYLTSAYAQKSEIVVLNGTTVVPTVNTDLFRINSFRIIATGTNYKPTGNITLRHLSDTPIYSYITAGYTRARNIAYTVPAGKTLYVTSWTAGYAYATNSTHYCRLYTRANVEPSTLLNTGSLFYGYSEVLCSNNTVIREFEMPTKLPAKTDIKVSAIADYAGIASVSLRGWLE